MQASYDAAQTTTENKKHWENADGLAAMAALSPTIRATLRNRSRYEIANNSYASGIVRSIASDMVGTGPRLQIDTGNDDDDRIIEKAWWNWSQKTQFAAKLRTMRGAGRCQDGEAFARFITNPRTGSPITLDLRLVEADQFAPPMGASDRLLETGGIIFDDWGNPLAYHVLKYHPGSLLGTTFETDIVRARDVIHWFNAERPGQVRGVPEITPALPLFAQLRRYTLAVIASAETAADLAAVLQSTIPGDDPERFEPLDTIEIERRQMLVLPDGYEIAQLKAEQPTTAYEAFVRCLLREIARCLCVPYNLAAGDSSTYNYASGRLDHQLYYKKRNVDRRDCETVVVEPTAARWWLEARQELPGLSDKTRALREMPDHSFAWDGDEHVDPDKESKSADRLVSAGLLTEAEYHARRGRSWEEIEAQRAKELGITVQEFRAMKREKFLGRPPERQGEKSTGGSEDDNE